MTIAPDATNHGAKDGTNFQYKDGRRFHNELEVSYILPNDPSELDRIYKQHYMLKTALNGNFHAPIEEQLKSGITVLDSGCGPASWTLDMAEAYPNSKFYGVDASLIFPEENVPENVEFMVANIAKKLPFPDNTFDFVYQRFLMLGLTSDDWDKTLKELYRVLKPGGYIEIVETDITEFVSYGDLITIVQNGLIRSLDKRNMVPRIIYELEERLQKVGFIHKKFTIVKLDMNRNTRIGRLVWADFKDLLLSSRHLLAQDITEWVNERVYNNYIENCAVECVERNTYGKTGIHYAVKPN